MFVKSKKKKMISVFGLFAMTVLIFLSYPLLAQAAEAKEEKATKISVSVTNSGIPASGNVIYAATYQTAYESISTGKFSEEVLNSPTWLDIAGDGVIQVAGHNIGKGETHDDTETIIIISQLFRTNFELLQTINQSNNGIFGTFTSPSNILKLHFPGESKKEYTDANGIAEGDVKEGLIVIMDSSRKLLYIGKADAKSGQIKVDINASQGLSSTVDNLKDAQTQGTLFTVSYNQTIEYTLKISKNLLNKGRDTLLSLKPDSNLIIDYTSIENTKTDLIPPIIASTVNFDTGASQSQLKKVAQQIGEGYIGQKLFDYNIKIPYTNKDVTIKIKAHLTPTVSLEREVQQGGKPIGEKMTIPVDAFDSPDYAFGINAKVFSSTGEGETRTPTINTSGINFVEADAQKATFAKGATYLIAKKTSQGTLLYDRSGNWKETGDLSKIKVSDYFSIKGGSKYIIGQVKAETIPVSNQRFNYNFDKNTEINQSLIQIFGLGKGDYSLIPVSPATGYELQKNFDFSIYMTYGTTSNGKPMTMTNLGFPTNESFKLNGLIPDYQTGKNGYTLLPVTSSKGTALNKWKQVILPIAGMILFICLLGIVLVKVT